MIIIDGYNLIGNTHAINLDETDAKEKLLEILNKYQAIMDVKIIAVFDGRDSNFLSEYENSKIEIIFSGENKTADEIIIDLCKKYSHARDTVIVSSDNEVIQAVRKNGLIPKKSNIFIKEVFYAIENYQEDETEKYLSPIEIQDWLKYFKDKND